MAQQILLPGMDSFNRVLCCRETFLTEIVREALSLARFDGAVLASLAADIDRAAKEAKKVRLMDELWRKARRQSSFNHEKHERHEKERRE